jgi:hypothetical protein
MPLPTDPIALKLGNRSEAMVHVLLAHPVELSVLDNMKMLSVGGDDIEVSLIECIIGVWRTSLKSLGQGSRKMYTFSPCHRPSARRLSSNCYGIDRPPRFIRQ